MKTTKMLPVPRRVARQWNEETGSSKTTKRPKYHKGGDKQRKSVKR